jgi:hypothetical protein
MSNPINFVKKSLISKQWAMCVLAKISIPFSSLMPDGILFFHIGRCGSTVVSNLLNQHPKISSHNEIFNPYYEKPLPAKPEDMLREHRARALPNHVVVETKFMESEQDLSILGMSIKEFVGLVKSCGYRKFIILERTNYLRRIISGKIGKARGGRWHNKGEKTYEPTTISLNIDRSTNIKDGLSLIEHFEYIHEQYRKLREALTEDDKLELTYEEDISENPLVAYDKICNWLNIQRLPVSIQYKKSNPFELFEVIENWKEVVKHLKDTSYEWMLEADS